MSPQLSLPHVSVPRAAVVPKSGVKDRLLMVATLASPGCREPVSTIGPSMRTGQGSAL